VSWWAGRVVRGLVGESSRVGVVGDGEHEAALLAGLGGGAVVDVGGGVQAQAAVPMFIVVPGEKDLAVLPGGLDRGQVAGGSRAGISWF
jgi:hypothetical protein